MKIKNIHVLLSTWQIEQFNRVSGVENENINTVDQPVDVRVFNRLIVRFDFELGLLLFDRTHTATRIKRHTSNFVFYSYFYAIPSIRVFRLDAANL